MDCRAWIRIKFDIYDKKFKTEMNINYMPESVDGVDDRVIEWFCDKYEEAYAEYYADRIRREKKETKRRYFERTKAEYERLKGELEKET